MRVRSENKGQIEPILAKLKGEYKMSQREVAKWCGVNICVVNLWATGKNSINYANLEKLKEALCILEGQTVRYKGQAIDILLGVK